MSNGNSIVWSNGNWVDSALASKAAFDAHDQAVLGAHGTPAPMTVGRGLVWGVSTWSQSDIRRAISVKDHGAKGDGATNDTAAIQAAIDATYTTGQPVYFPSGAYPGGVYLINAPLKLHKGTRLIGDHVSSWMPDSFRSPTIWAMSTFSGGAMLEIHDARLTGDVEHPSGGSITGLRIHGAGTGTSLHGIHWKGRSDDWVLTNVEVSSCTGYGYKSEGYGTPNYASTELNWFHCHASGCGGGWHFSNRSFDHRLFACVAHGSTGDGFVLASDVASVELLGCRAEWNNTTGFALLSQDKVTLHGCITDRNGQHGILVNSSAGGPILLDGCYTNRDSAAAASYAGLKIVAGGVIVNGLTQRLGYDDAGGGIRGPYRGVEVGAATVLLQGWLAGTNAAFSNLAAGP